MAPTENRTRDLPDCNAVPQPTLVLHCTLSVLICPDCPGLCLVSLPYNTYSTNIHGHGGIFFRFICCLFVLRPYLFLRLITPFVFTIQHITQTSMPSPGFEPAIPPGDRPKTNLKQRGHWERQQTASPHTAETQRRAKESNLRLCV
jgi:hypothetical protein